MTVGGVHLTTRADAAQHLTAWTRTAATRTAGSHTERPLGQAGTLGGHTLDVALRPRLAGDVEIVFTFRDVPRTSVAVPPDHLRGEQSIGLIRQLENRLADLPATLARVTNELDTALSEQAKARDALTRPFKHTEALTASRVRVADITAAMEKTGESDPMGSTTASIPTQVPGHAGVPADPVPGGAIANDPARARRYKATNPLALSPRPGIRQ
jgi:hypothetical protein